MDEQSTWIVKIAKLWLTKSVTLHGRSKTVRNNFIIRNLAMKVGFNAFNQNFKFWLDEAVYISILSVQY
jgi:hypothetical protein